METMINEKLNLTEKEIEVIIKITESDFYEYDNAPVWSFSVYDFLTFKGKVRSGVISSLVQKGLIFADDHKDKRDNCVGFTKDGFIKLKDQGFIK
jgi:hypothetical protein